MVYRAESCRRLSWLEYYEMDLLAGKVLYRIFGKMTPSCSDGMCFREGPNNNLARVPDPACPATASV